jgi:hypothetical protein
MVEGILSKDKLQATKPLTCVFARRERLLAPVVVSRMLTR